MTHNSAIAAVMARGRQSFVVSKIQVLAFLRCRSILHLATLVGGGAFWIAEIDSSKQLMSRRGGFAVLVKRVAKS